MAYESHRFSLFPATTQCRAASWAAERPQTVLIKRNAVGGYPHIMLISFKSQTDTVRAGNTAQGWRSMPKCKYIVYPRYILYMIHARLQSTQASEPAD